jgi:cellulose synthase/poly-beta-1,6-N-acetylglucosamine synthase-like glycosyltransferase
MIGFIELSLICVFLFFYTGLFYNLPILAAGVWNIRRRRGVSRSRLGGERSLFFSLLVAAKDEERVVGRLLESFSRLNYPADRFEVVVVDDGSEDGTADICRRFAERFGNMRFLQLGVSGGKAKALNYGLKFCRGEIVGVFDADNVVARGALINVAEYFEDAKVSAVQGSIQSINSDENMLTQIAAYEDLVRNEAFLSGKEALGLFVSLRGCVEFIRRGVLVELGGFDERTLAEDVEISARLTKLGHKVRYAHDVRGWQESPARLQPYLKQRTRWYRGYMEVALRYSRLLTSVNRRSLDAEVTLFMPLVALASMISYWIASWAVLSSAPFGVVLGAFSLFSMVGTSVLVVLCGLALVCVSRPRSGRSLLWLPFVFGYWSLESFLVLYASLLIVFRRPRRWVKTERSGAVTSPEFALELSSHLD